MAPRAWFGAFAILACLALLPIWLPAAPPFFDVPNHLARATILARRDGSDFYASLFTLNWRVLPNLTSDVLLQGLVRILPPILALKTFLSFIVLVLASAFAALHRQIHGERSLAALGGFSLVYTLSFFMGFMNFVLGFGLALASVAIWGSLRRGPLPPRVATTGILLLGTFFTHLLAFLVAILFGIVIWASDRRERRRAMAEWMFLGAIPLALYLAFSPTRGEAGDLIFRPAIFKLAAILNLWRSGVVALDAVAVPLYLAGIGLLLGGSRGRAPAFARPLIGVCVVLFLVAPFGGRTTQVLDSRLPLLIVAAALLAVNPEAAREARSRIGYVLVGGAIVVQAAALAATYRADDGDVSSVLALYRAAPPRSYVFVGVAPEVGRRENGPYLRRHANDAGYAAAVNEAYVSDLFSISTQQPLLYNEVGASLAMVVPVAGDPRRPTLLIEAARKRLRSAGLAGVSAYAHYAAPDGVTPLDVPDAKLVLAHSGLGIYRLAP